MALTFASTERAAKFKVALGQRPEIASGANVERLADKFTLDCVMNGAHVEWVVDMFLLHMGAKCEFLLVFSENTSVFLGGALTGNRFLHLLCRDQGGAWSLGVQSTVSSHM